MSMLIMIAGPYSSPNEKERKTNLHRLNSYALEVFERGHIPIVGVSAALSTLTADGRNDEDVSRDDIMIISLAFASRCDAVLRIGRSSGADAEVAWFEAHNRPIYEDLADIPDAKAQHGSYP